MKTRLLVGIVWLILPIIALAQVAPDENTLFYATFDDSLTPDIAKGSWQPTFSGDVACAAEGKFGGALRLPERSRLSYAAGDGNLNPDCGTVSLWIKTDWDGGDGVSRPIFGFSAEGRNHVTVNVVRTNKLGVAMCSGTEDDWVWRRAEKDSTDWKAGVWHHIAAVWGPGVLQFYLDGAPVGEPATDARTPKGKFPEFVLAGTGTVIDDFRIAGVLRSAEEIMAEASAPSRGPLYCHLSKLQPSESKQAFGHVGIDCRMRVDGMSMPLILDGAPRARGIGVRAPAALVFALPEGFAEFAATIGIDDLAGEGASVVFRVLADGKEVFKSDKFENGTTPKRIQLSIAGAKTLELVADDCGDGNANDLADWADAMLMREGAKPVYSVPRKMPEKTLEMYKRRRDAYHFTFELPPAEKGYLVAVKNYMDEIDPSAPPQAFGIDSPLSTFATPGEYEPLCFVIYAAKDLKDVRVEPTELKGEAGTIPTSAVDVRAVKRCLYRRIYTRPPEDSEIISRFLEKRPLMDIETNTLQEMHITIHVPEDAKAGAYAGALRVSGADCGPTEVPVSLEVLPFKLRPLERKKYGMYYRMGISQEVPGRVELELQDMREHGASILYPGIGINYDAVDDRIKANYEELREGLDLMRKFGFHGSIPVHDGLIALARLCGATDLDVSQEQTGESLNTNEAFQSAAKEALEGLLKVQQEYPEFELLPTHMDEVLGKDRLPLYINLAKAVRQVPQLRLYITIHNRPLPIVEEMTRELLPYVDVRCYNGHSMDAWIKGGHTFEEMAADLKATNDEAWIYYNIRGSFFLARWMRIVNGMYMWVGPFKAHCIWIYHSVKGNPFDDTDGPHLKGHDFGLAVPDPADGKTPVPTRHWECYREGIDDMRYICMLEDLIAESKQKSPQASAEAQKWLDSLRDMFPKAADIADIELESPLLIAFSQKVTGEEYQNLRRKTADHILKLLSVR